MLDPTKPLKAADIVDNPAALQSISQNYVIIFDPSWGGTFLNMITAINLLDEHGWETKGIAHSQGVMYALAQRIAGRSTLA